MSKQSQLDAYADDNEKLAAFRRAQADLYDVTARETKAGIRHETPEFHRANQAVIDTAKNLPKHLRRLAKSA